MPAWHNIKLALKLKLAQLLLYIQNPLEFRQGISMQWTPEKSKHFALMKGLTDVYAQLLIRNHVTSFFEK